MNYTIEFLTYVDKLSNIVRFVFRFICFILINIGFIILIIMFFYLPDKVLRSIIQVWAQLVLYSLGIKLKLITEENEEEVSEEELKSDSLSKANLIVSNHISWIDILAIYKINPVKFIARIELKKWPIINKIIEKSGAIFINRQCKKDILKVNDIIINDIKQSNASIGFFPEGCTSEGENVLKFKPALFEAAIKSDAIITPIVLYYSDISNKHISPILNYSGDTNFLETVINTLNCQNIILYVFILKTINSNQFKNRKDLSNYTFNIINTKYIAEKNLRILRQNQEL